MKLTQYVKDSYYEFKNHVTWPTWPVIQRDTIIVSVATVILAIFLYFVDGAFKNLLDIVYNLI